MSDRGRSPEEIEAAIEDRQEDIAEDLEDLEYHLSRRGMKDQARNTASKAKERVVERTVELREEVAGRVRSASSGAKQQMDEWSQGVSQAVKDNPWKAALVGAGLAIGVGAGVAQMTKSRSSSRPTRGSKTAVMVAWLNDAYLNERGAVPILRNHIRDVKEQPMMRERLEQHLADTERHSELLMGCIERLGGKVSSAKGAAGNLLGRVQAVTTEPAGDEVVKNALIDYASEQFEIASYRALIAGAEQIGDSMTARVCRVILADEEDMASWWARQIPLLTQRHLSMFPDDRIAEVNRSGNLG